MWRRAQEESDFSSTKIYQTTNFSAFFLFQVYLGDVFGLKTLAARGDLILCSVPGVEHVQWHSNETVFHTCMEKWLV